MAHLKPRQATVTLYQGDDMPRLAELKRAADQAAEGGRMDDGADETAAYNAFLTEVADRAVEVVVQSIGRRRWRDLTLAHPPRMVESEPDEEGKTRQVVHDEDVQWDVNTDTFPRALLMYADEEKPEIRTIAAPSLDSEDERAEFVDDELAEGDFEQLWIAAFHLNSAPPASPKELAQRSSESTT
jgi:hypothetical protein